jgi:hypothetical protein
MPSGYLRYTFNNNKLLVSDAPFKAGSTLLVDFKRDSSLLVSKENIKKKSIYFVKLLDKDKLILTVIDEHGEPVDLNFNKLKNSFDNVAIDNGQIIIVHEKKSQNAKVTTRSHLYIYNDTINIANKPTSQNPIFSHGRSGNFGDFLTENFIFPGDYPLDVFSEELVVDFDIANNRINNIVIVKGLRKDIDSVIVSLIQKTSAKWSLPEPSGNPAKITLRFHFKFLLALYDPGIEN